MKSHISATIDAELLESLHAIRKRERRTLSNVLEAAIARYIEGQEPTDQIITTEGAFKGSFSRRDTYDREKH